MHVIVPGADEYAIVRLQDEVVADIVNDDGLINVSA